MPSTRSRRRVRRSPAQWRRLIAEQAESGLAQEAFCRARGLAVSSFCNWRRKLAASAAVGDGEALPAFIELAPQTRAPTDEGWDVELELGVGVVLRLRRR